MKLNPQTLIEVSRTIKLLGVLLPLLFATGCMARIKTGQLIGMTFRGQDAVQESWFQLKVDRELAGPVNYIQSEDDTFEPHPDVQYVSHQNNDEYTTKAVVFVIPETTWETEHVGKESGEDVDKILFTVRERFYRYLLRSYPHPTRARYAFRKSDDIIEDHRVITVTSHVTDIKKGNGFLRYLIGFELGQSFIQIEGEIYDGPNREKKLGEYIIRRGSPGYAQNGLNPNVVHTSYTLRYAAEEAIAAFCDELPRHIGGVQYIKSTGKGNSQSSEFALIH